MSPFDESFLTFLPTFFTDLDRLTWSHPWFVAYLPTFTLVLLPVLAPLARRQAGGARRSWVWLYLPILPLAWASRATRRPCSLPCPTSIMPPSHDALLRRVQEECRP